MSTAHVETAPEATEHRISLGHHQIEIIVGPSTMSTSVARMEGFRQALGMVGLPARDEYCVNRGCRSKVGINADGNWCAS